MPRPTSGKRTLEPSEPWSGRGIQRKYYPAADGKSPPPRNCKDRNDRIKTEFLTAYYRLNRSYARLLEIRGKKIGDPARREGNERTALQRIELALRHRDELEDEYAPYGIIAEPVMKNGFAVNVKFSFGSVRSKAQRNAHVLSSSAYISIPLPPGGKPEGWTFPGKEELLRRLNSRPGANQGIR